MYLPKKLITAGKPVVKAVVVKAAPSALPLKEPVITIASPVIVQITIVSKKVPVIEIRPCLTAEFVLAAAAAIGALPSPASFENTPLPTPFCIAI